MNSDLVDSVRDGKHTIMYEDEKTYVILSDKPLSPGHMIVVPKNVYHSTDEISKEDMTHFYYVASFASTAIYEIFGGGQDLGTNILLNEGNGSGSRFRQVTIDIIPRKPEDGINFRWEPKPGDQQQIAEVEKSIRDQTFFIEQGGSVTTSGGSISEVSKPSAKTESVDGGPENYLVKQLNRIP